MERTTETAVLPMRNPSTLPQSAEAREHRKLRFALPTLPRRQSCLTRRAVLAAMREAELAQWETSGGDFLSSMHQPIL